MAASDALALKFRRRRPSVRQPPMPLILPDVIEISAPRPDEEAEEREQLREMAAQSIGLGAVIVQPETRSRDNSIEEEEEEDDGEERLNMSPNPMESREVAEARTLDSPVVNNSALHDSTLTVSIPSGPLPSRFRSGSMLAHTRTNSTTLAAVPTYPTTPSALSQFKQAASTLPKYYPPPSLRIFALSKSWRSRFMVLSSPTALVTRGSAPSVSYLHLFKSSNPEEKESERLEINEDSVVFVAEEEVGGRRHVVKVGGVDVGAMKKELNNEEGGRTMWFLQITDAAEAQKWITVIKSAILGQRCVRLRRGLNFPYT